MQLHTSLVALVNHPCQRVPIGLGRTALFTRQIEAPRLQLAFIQGVTLRTNLKDDGIAAVFLQLVQLIAERLLHLLGTDSLELSVDTLYPRSTEFTLHLCLHGQCQQYCQKSYCSSHAHFK